MLLDGLVWLWDRLRPREGWLSLFLLLAVILVLNTAVLAVGWVPEDMVIVPATLLGLLLGIVLGRRSLAPWAAWALITAYGLLIVVATLARLWPPASLLVQDWTGLRVYWLENGAEFLERSRGWITAVAVGSRSNETIVFALLLGLTGWFLAAYLGWSAYREQRPLLGLMLLGLLVAFNGYLGGAPLELAAMYVGLAVLTTAVFQIARLEDDWERRRVDYSTQIRLSAIGYAAGIGMALLAFSLLLPALNVRAAAQVLLDNEQMMAFEETLDRAFGGVETQRTMAPSPGALGGSGVLPRSFLLGSGPELERFIMMTAEAELLAGPPGMVQTTATHWRGLSYAVYTGQGWALSEEQEKQLRAGDLIPLPETMENLSIRQQVYWRYDNRVTRYSLGLPERIDQAGTAVFRDQTDLVRLLGQGPVRYEIISRLPAPSRDQLRRAGLEDVPTDIALRYTQLPQNLPRRVRDLAAEVTAEASSPYAQALALEAFLRQYPYDLSISAPPADVDVVDYFLFDLQRGYCDYFASAMAVMARSLGLPARIAVGYAATAADAEGVQTVRQSDAHSWAEIYFADIGWVEFEPTTSFASPNEAAAYEQASDVGILPEAGQPAPPPIPQQKAAQRPWPWQQMLGAAGLMALAALLVRRWRQRPHVEGDAVQQAYGRLQEGAARLGQPLPPSQTPAEFSAALQKHLAHLEGRGRLGMWAARVSAPALRLGTLFALRQYGQGANAESEADQLWQQVRRPLLALWFARMLGRSEAQLEPEKDE
jgi:transglutaminase-like putative cysteine protease